MTETDETPLPPYSGESPRCPKCGEERAATTYMEFGRCSHYGDTHMVVGLDRNERLHRACRNCGYQWDEAIRD